jgi:hypothetical protein
VNLIIYIREYIHFHGIPIYVHKSSITEAHVKQTTWWIIYQTISCVQIPRILLFICLFRKDKHNHHKCIILLYLIIYLYRMVFSTNINSEPFSVHWLVYRLLKDTKTNKKSFGQPKQCQISNNVAKSHIIEIEKFVHAIRRYILFDFMTTQ